MKIEIPEKLKDDVPQTAWGKILMATPVIMTVLATMLAGLSSSEMTRAQYSRSLAAQQQSKAGDQWSFFQAKRLRGALQRNALDILQSTVVVAPLTLEALQSAVAGAQALEGPAGKRALACLQEGKVPDAGARADFSDKLKQAMHAVEASRPDAELQALLGDIGEQDLEAALGKARDQVEGLDAATEPVNKAIDELESVLALRQGEAVRGGADFSPVLRSYRAARLQYNAARYETEARLNQAIANLYELQVRKSNYAAERHHRRSQRFFFGMLGAQAAVIIATFAIAARKRNLLWSLAAAAGIAALALAVYVYLYV